MSYQQCEKAGCEAIGERYTVAKTATSACVCTKHTQDMTAWMYHQPTWHKYLETRWARGATEIVLQGAGLPSMHAARQELISVYKDEQRAHQSLYLTLIDWLATADEVTDNQKGR